MSTTTQYETPTPYRISTITATGYVGTSINLDLLYKALEIDLDTTNEQITEGIVYIEYGIKKTETIYKGFSKKNAINRRKEKPTKRFDNQVTIVYVQNINNITQRLNIKTFRNGNIQITGIKSIDQGGTIIDKLIGIIRNIYDTKDKDIVDDINKLQNLNFRIRLINTDYKIGFGIKRDILHKIIKNEYGLFCNYEPVIYPGVKLHYFYNKINKNGICNCSSKCNDSKNGGGNGNMDCKKITIAIFQSGCIIITGSQTKEQIDECYNFINKVLYENANRIEKKTLTPLLTSNNMLAIEKEKILIPKSKIINF